MRTYYYHYMMRDDTANLEAHIGYYAMHVLLLVKLHVILTFSSRLFHSPFPIS